MSALRPFVLEAGVAVVMVLVFVASLVARRPDRRAAGWIATLGILVVTLGSFAYAPTGSGMGGRFVQDGLALFAKRLFLAATFIGLLGGLSVAERAFVRRACDGFTRSPRSIR